MATTQITEAQAQELGIPALIRRAHSGEEIRIESECGTVLMREHLAPSLDNPLDNSIAATLKRFRRLESQSGQPLTMGEDYASDMEKIMAMRRPGRGDPWE